MIPTKQFKRDIKKHFIELITPQWIEVMNCLIHDVEPPERYQNHPLKGDKSGLWDCHIKPDLVLLYEKSEHFLILHRLATHSELF
ncbi:MAG: type II toxin-antitoxin system YafQ family toxin [Acinetobacter sp.]|nr:type II toxin-antitoxin system YafQ family toxin [Acinetobacter sp.]